VYIYIKNRKPTPHTYLKLLLIEFEQRDPAAKATGSLEESKATLNLIVGGFPPRMASAVVFFISFQ